MAGVSPQAHTLKLSGMQSIWASTCEPLVVEPVRDALDDVSDRPCCAMQSLQRSLATLPLIDLGRDLIKANSQNADLAAQRPLLGVKRTWCGLVSNVR